MHSIQTYGCEIIEEWNDPHGIVREIIWQQEVTQYLTLMNCLR